MRLIDADALKPLLREHCIDGDEVVAKWYDIMGVDEHAEAEGKTVKKYRIVKGEYVDA